MELRIRLDLPDPAGPLSLEASAGEGGESRPVEVQLPFDAAETATLTRALDLNASPRLKRWFDTQEIERLTAWGVLVDPPADLPVAPPADPKPITLSGLDLHRAPLRELVRARLRRCLIEPLADRLGQELAYLRAKGKDRTLHLRIEIWLDQLTLFQYPWELLQGDPMLNGEVQISRYIRYRHHVERLAPARRWRLLVLHSEPDGLPALQLADAERISEAMAQRQAEDAVVVHRIDRAGITDLTDALAGDRQTATILHFAGHGDFGRRCERCGAMTAAADPPRCRCGQPFPQGTTASGHLAFTADGSGGPPAGAAHWISAEQLRQALAGSNVQLVVLNACKTGLGRGGEDCFNGIAQRLMASVPAVVASPHPLANQAATAFSRVFYEELARRSPLVDALRWARGRMQPRYPDDWYRPVLYLRAQQDNGGRLFAVGAAADDDEPAPGLRPAVLDRGDTATTGRVVPERRTAPPSASPLREQTLRRSLALLEQQWAAAQQQAVTAIDAVARVQAEQQAEQLQRRIDALRRELGEGA